MKQFTVRLATLSLLTAFLSACTNDADKYYLLTDTARGIESGTEIWFNGIIVGEVDDIGFSRQKIKLTLDVRKDLRIGRSSTFHCIKTGIFEKSLEISGSGDSEFYKPGSSISSNITYQRGPMDLLVSAVDSIDVALKAGESQLRKIGDYKNGKTNYEVYTFYYKEPNSAMFSGESHIIFVSAKDTLAYDTETEYKLPVKFDGTYFYCDNSASRYKFNGFNEVLCVKDGCFEQDFPSFTNFREALK